MQNDKTFFNVTYKLKKYIIAHSTASPTRFDNCILQLRLSLTFFKDGKKKGVLYELYTVRLSTSYPYRQLSHYFHDTTVAHPDEVQSALHLTDTFTFGSKDSL